VAAEECRLQKAIQMTIGHPQSPYPERFSVGCCPEDSKHWVSLGAPDSEVVICHWCAAIIDTRYLSSCYVYCFMHLLSGLLSIYIVNNVRMNKY
jgi:hypothetical protein